MYVKSIIDKTRLKITDDDAYRFTNDDILEVVNEALRFVRNIYVDQAPEIVMELPIEGTLEAGSNTIIFPYLPIRIVDVRCNGKSLHTTRLKNIEDVGMKGTPKVFCPVGKASVMLFPIPQENISYSIYLIKPAEDVAEDEELPFPDDFEDAIVEFVAVRLSLIDEFDESMEAQLTAQITKNISEKLARYTSSPCVVDSYY